MNRIRDLREDADLKQSELAAATGISQMTLSNYESGKSNPDSYAIIKLAEFFNVTTDYLLGVTRNNFRDLSDVAKKLDETTCTLAEISDLLKKLNG